MDPAITPEYFSKPTAIWLPFAKVDKAQRMVYGFASTESLDADGETIDLDAIAEALPGYMKFANIREMHGNSAVGKARDAAIMTKGDKKGLYLGAKIVDDAAWNKVLEEVYQGFSVGGKKLEKVGNKVTKIHLSEISIVDRPANPDCTFDQVAKRYTLVERDPAVDAALAKAAQKDFKVQTLIFSKDRFKVAGAAQAWAKKNGFESGSVDGTGNSFRLRQFDPASRKTDSHRTFELTDGVQAVGCTAPGVSKLAKLDGSRLSLATMSLDLMKADMDKGGPGSGPHAREGTEKWTAAQHLKAARQAEREGKDAANRGANAEQHYADEKFHREEAQRKSGTPIGKGTDTSTNAPGGNAGRKEDCTMPGMTKEAMDAHKARHAQIGKELAEMAEAHKDDKDMSEAIKGAMAHHAALAEAFKKHEVPSGAPEGQHAESDGDEGPQKKLAGHLKTLQEMSDSVNLAGTKGEKTGKNAAGDPSSNEDWKHAAEKIDNLAKGMGILTEVVTALAKGTPARPKTRSVGKVEDGALEPELLAKVETAAVKAEADKDPMSLLKLVHSGGLGGVTRN